MSRSLKDDVQDLTEKTISTITTLTAKTSQIEENNARNLKRVNLAKEALEGTYFETEAVESNSYVVDVPEDSLSTCAITETGGKSLVWNQLINRTLFGTTDYTSNGITFHNNGDGTFTLNGTTSVDYAQTYNDFCQAVYVYKDHYYFFDSDYTAIDESNHVFICTSVFWSATNLNTIKKIQQCGESHGSAVGFFVHNNFTEVPLTNYKTQIPKLYDLTLMFGSGNEASSLGVSDFDSDSNIETAVNNFKTMFPDSDYEYNAGELISVNTNRIRSIGVNIFDFKGWLQEFKDTRGMTMYGGTATISGESITIHSNVVDTYTETYGSKVNNRETYPYLNQPIEPNTKYRILAQCDKSSGNPWWFINGRTVDGYYGGCSHTSSNVYFYTFTTPPDAKFIQVRVGNRDANDTTVWTNVQIIRGDYTSVTENYPSAYQESTIDLSESIRTLDGYGWSAGSARNWIDWENKKYHQEVYKYTFTGEETWGHNSAWGEENSFAWYHLPKNAPSYGNYSTIANTIINLPFKSVTPNNIAWNDDPLTYAVLENGIYVNCGKSTAEEVAAYMKNHTMYYELADPIITDISSILPEDNFLRIENGGTITFENSDDSFRIPAHSKILFEKSL